MAIKCQFRKKNGIRCGANAQPTNGLCVFHDPARASEGRRARRAGGIARSRLAALPGDTPDHPRSEIPQTSQDSWLSPSISVRRGKLDPRVAIAMGYLTSVLLRSLEQGPVEERLAKIEAALAENAQEAKGA